MRKIIVAVVLSLAVLAIAFATITFDPTTGTGFVGKGDVQAALGWNNKDLQINPVHFTYRLTATYTGTCYWVTGHKEHSWDTETTIDVNSAMQFQNRTQNQITGFNLLGYGDAIGDGVPVNGSACDGEGDNGQGKWIDVQVISSHAGLYVNGVQIY